jgi:cytochrome P450
MTPTTSYNFRRSAAGSALLTRYRDVCSALQDPRFAHWWLADGTSSGNQRAMERWFERMENTDSPVRAALAQRLSARAFEKHRTSLTSTVAGLLAEVRDGVPFELVSGYAVPLVRSCVAEVIGVPAEQRPIFDEIVGPMCARLFSDGERETELLERWAEMIDRVVAEDGAGDHLIGDLIRAQRNGEDLQRSELSVFTAQFAAAAYENISNFIANSIAVLSEHRDVWDTLADDPTAVFTTIEELLRYAGPMNYVPLIAREDIAGAECVVKRGSTVLACLPLANQDREQFPDANRLDHRRRPNHHVSFGTGRFACIGASFARAQAAVAILGLAERFELPELVRDRIQPKKSRLFYGPKQLPAILRRRELSVRGKDSAE